jgi:microcystin degradation protein MlrC
MLLAPTTTFDGIGKRLNEHAAGLTARDGLISLSVFHGFPWTDAARVGTRVVAMAADGAADPSTTAHELATWIWERRDEFQPPPLSPDEAVAAALDSGAKMAVIAEATDNVGGGAPGDSTRLLRALLRRPEARACLSSIWDANVVEHAWEVGVGARIKGELGGRHGEASGHPLPFEAEVLALTDGQLVLRAIAAGMPLDYGRTAALRIGNVDVIVASKREQSYERNVFDSHGIDIDACRIVAVKSSAHFRAGFQPLTSAIFLADGPGFMSMDFNSFTYEHLDRPIWPLDADARLEAVTGTR